jgi:peptidoglycan/LPS O-acetylase OafA/YrhL
MRPLDVLLLVGFGLSGGWVARALPKRALVYLSKASYSMYALHIPILWWAVHSDLPISGNLRCPQLEDQLESVSGKRVSVALS